MKRDPVQTALGALAEAARRPRDEATLALVRDMLAYRSNHVVGRAARVAREADLAALGPDLIATFRGSWRIRFDAIRDVWPRRKSSTRCSLISTPPCLIRRSASLFESARLSSTRSAVSFFPGPRVTLCVGASNFFWLPVMGALSDKTGRRPLLFAVTFLALLTAYPALSWLVSTPSFSRLLAVELWFSFLFGSYNGAMVVFLTEIMPPEIRTAGFSLAFSSATAIFGGFTPAICTYLIHATGNPASPGFWLSFAAACSLIAAIVLSRSRALLQSRV